MQYFICFIFLTQHKQSFGKFFIYKHPSTPFSTKKKLNKFTNIIYYHKLLTVFFLSCPRLCFIPLFLYFVCSLYPWDSYDVYNLIFWIFKNQEQRKSNIYVWYNTYNTKNIIQRKIPSEPKKAGIWKYGKCLLLCAGGATT